MWEAATFLTKGEDGVECRGNTCTVCDGHGGSECKDFMLAQKFEFYGLSDEEVELRIKEANDKFLGSPHSKMKAAGLVPGTTLTTVTVDPYDKKRVHVTSLGDSEGIVVKRDGCTKALTKVHDVKGEEAIAAIERGGEVVKKKGSTYIKVVGTSGPCLNMTRALGDQELIPVVSCVPHVLEYSLQDDDYAIVVASDGIWKVMSKAEVARSLLQRQSLEMIARTAYKRYSGCADDITIAVFLLHPHAQGARKRKRD